MSPRRLSACTPSEPGLWHPGQVDGDAVRYYRKPERLHTAGSEFSVDDEMPRVDIAYSYAGSTGRRYTPSPTPVKGIVQPLRPGMGTPAEVTALEDAISKGVVALQFARRKRLRSGQHRAARDRIIAADNLTPQKARILLGLALTRTKDRTEIERIFATY
jgi:L-asparaginase